MMMMMGRRKRRQKGLPSGCARKETTNTMGQTREKKKARPRRFKARLWRGLGERSVGGW